MRRYAPSRTSSQPGTAVAARWPKTPSKANGARTGSRSDTVPADAVADSNRAAARARNAVGVPSHARRTVSLN
ncbi:Uncharacterised protein [Mycobacterium tuberculosis]|uniref:Uncharacterized protein n=1 Tax=Mycobacterium tuberculosis TaxID=1773 RepID=A0A0U0S733_MYCTX|nr:Uncharacterised protein [Mycobacterium tuberculosis]COX15129.1 Uncharacterised protein [Mycobacterium tuberculosis]